MSHEKCAPATVRTADGAVDIAVTAALGAALRCLGSPTSLAAIGALLLNDHWLKQASPSWLTGKLSDFAGLYFFPFLVLSLVFLALLVAGALPAGRVHRAVSVRRSTVDTAVLTVFVGTGLFFAALKTSPVTAAPALALLETVLGSRLAVVLDPSDLVALTVLPFAYHLWRTTLTRQRAVGETDIGQVAQLRRALQLAVLVVAGIASLATTPAAPIPSVVAVAVDPDLPHVLYASVKVPAFVGTRDQFSYRLVRSTDAGDRWDEVAPRGGGLNILTMPGRPRTFILPRLGGVWRWSEGTAEAVRIWPPEPDDGRGNRETVPLVVLGPWDDGVLFVAQGGDVLRSQDAGATWQHLTLPAHMDVRAFATDPKNPGHVLLAGEQRIYTSADAGSTWSDLGPAPTSVYRLAISPHDAHLVFAAGVDGGLYRSPDLGSTWQQVWTDQYQFMSYTGVVFDAHDPRRVLVTRWFGSLLHSADAGQTWSEHPDIQFAVGAASAHSPNHRFYVAASDKGVFRERAGLSLPWQATWQPVNVGLGFGASDLAERAANVFGVLATGITALVLARFLTPGRFRYLLAVNIWELLLGFTAGVIVLALIVGYLVPGTCARPQEALGLVVPAGAVAMVFWSLFAPMTQFTLMAAFGTYGAVLASAAVPGLPGFPIGFLVLVPSVVASASGLLSARKGRAGRARAGLVSGWALLLLAWPWIGITVHGLFGPECR